MNRLEALKSLLADLKIDLNAPTTPQVNNEYLNSLFNTLIVQNTTDDFAGIENAPLLKAFEGEYVESVSDGIQFLTNLLIADEDYDPDAIIPTHRSIAKTISNTCLTEYQKKWKLSFSKSVISRAFTSIPRLDEFLSQYNNQMDQSIAYWTYGVILEQLLPNVFSRFHYLGVDNSTTTQGNTALQDAISFGLGIHENANGIPTRAFNIDGRLRKRRFDSKGDWLMLIHPDTLNDIKTKGLASKYNENFINPLDKFSEVIVVAAMPRQTWYVIHKDALRILKRINESGSQYFPESIQYFLFRHLWIIPALIFWGGGYVYSYELPETKTISNALVPQWGPEVQATINGSNINIPAITFKVVPSSVDRTINDTNGEYFVHTRLINSAGDIVSEQVWNKVGNANGAKSKFVSNLATYAILPTTFKTDGTTTFVIPASTNIPKDEYTAQITTYFGTIQSGSGGYAIDGTNPQAQLKAGEDEETKTKTKKAK